MTTSLITKDYPLELSFDKASRPAVKLIHHLFFCKPHTREDIARIDNWIKNLPNAYTECPYPLYQFLENGLYTREIHMRKGDLVCSRIHKHDYFIAVLKGICWVINEYESRTVIAPCAFSIKGGAKNILFILEDTVWIDTHTVTAKTKQDAENEIFVESYAMLEGEKECLVG